MSQRFRAELFFFLVRLLLLLFLSFYKCKVFNMEPKYEQASKSGRIFSPVSFARCVTGFINLVEHVCGECHVCMYAMPTHITLREYFHQHLFIFVFNSWTTFWVCRLPVFMVFVDVVLKYAYYILRFFTGIHTKYGYHFATQPPSQSGTKIIMSSCGAGNAPKKKRISEWTNTHNITFLECHLHPPTPSSHIHSIQCIYKPDAL